MIQLSTKGLPYAIGTLTRDLPFRFKGFWRINIASAGWRNKYSSKRIVPVYLTSINYCV